jgi:hypothetical protein
MHKFITINAKGVRNRIFSALALCAAGALLSSCELAVQDITAPQWQPDVLAPIAYANLELENFDELAVISMSAYVEADELGLTPGIIQPGQAQRRSGVTAGPFPISWVDGVTSVEAGEAKLRVKIKNEIPVGISDGAIIRVVQSATGETVLEYAMTQSLDGYGRVADSVTVLDVDFASGLEFWIEDMTIQPIQGEEILPGAGFQIDAEVKFDNVREARVTSGTNVTFTDTTALKVDLADDLSRYKPEGELRLLVGNGFPFGGRVDVYFVSKNGQNTLGNLTYDPISVNIPAIDAQGFALESAQTEISIPINEEQIRVMARSEFVGYSGEIFAPSSPSSVVANGDRALDVKLIADIQFTIQP